MKPIDFTKPVQTRDGRKVRILCTDAAGSKLPVIGLIANPRGGEDLYSWGKSGRWAGGSSEESPADLVQVPEHVTCWFNVYRRGPKGTNYSRADADMVAFEGRIGVLRVTLEGATLIEAAMEPVA